MQRFSDIAKIDRIAHVFGRLADSKLGEVRAARARIAQLHDQHSHVRSEIGQLRSALDALYAEPRVVDRQRLFAVLRQAGAIRGRWAEARATIEWLDLEMSRAADEADSLAAAAVALRGRADRLMRVSHEKRRVAHGQAARAVTNEIEEQAWKQRCK